MSAVITAVAAFALFAALLFVFVTAASKKQKVTALWLIQNDAEVSRSIMTLVCLAGMKSRHVLVVRKKLILSEKIKRRIRYHSPNLSAAEENAIHSEILQVVYRIYKRKKLRSKK